MLHTCVLVVFLLFGSGLALSQIPAFAIDNMDFDRFRYVLDIPGGYINDHCLIRAGDRWHLYFIQGEVSDRGEPWGRDGNEITIGHAISSDLITWSLLAPALKVGTEDSSNAGHIYAPYVIEHGGKYVMFYTASPASYRFGEYIMMATSEDLVMWERNPYSSPIVPDSSWAAYHPSGIPVACRDPHLIRHHRFGYILYYTSQLRDDSTTDARSCIAAATSSDLVNWIDRGPVLVRQNRGFEPFPYAVPESPCVIVRDSLYYLFWKGGVGTRYAISDDPLNFRDRDSYFLEPSHASEVVEWNGRWIVTSCSRMLYDLDHSKSDRTRGLFIAEILWNGRWPTVVRWKDR